jgi:hypothetical protein
MKKAFFVTTLILVVAFAAFATESDPSNTVGFIKYQYVVGPDTVGFGLHFTPFALPFNYYRPGYVATTSMDTIIGNQGANGDELWNQNSGAIATYFAGWYGAFPMLNTQAYYWNHPNYASPPLYVNVTTAGEVNTGLVNYGIVPTNFTSYGVPIASPTLFSSMEMDLTGMTYFEVWNQNTGAISTYYGGWYPDGTLQPGQAISIKNNDGVPSPSPWIYDPTDDPGRGTVMMQTPPTRVPPRTEPIQRVAPTTPKKRAVPSKRTH